MFEGRIPVIDSWGNKIGDFIPAGEGCGLFFLLLMVVLIGIVILTLPIWLPILAIYYLIKGDHKKAIAFLIATVVVYVGLFIYFDPLGIGEANRHSRFVSDASRIEELITVELTDLEYGYPGWYEPYGWWDGGWKIGFVLHNNSMWYVIQDERDYGSVTQDSEGTEVLTDGSLLSALGVEIVLADGSRVSVLQDLLTHPRENRGLEPYSQIGSVVHHEGMPGLSAPANSPTSICVPVCLAYYTDKQLTDRTPWCSNYVPTEVRCATVCGSYQYQDVGARLPEAREGIGRIAVQEYDGGFYVMYADGSNLTRITPAGSFVDVPYAGAPMSWSPDASRIAYAEGMGFSTSIVVMDADGANKKVLLTGRIGPECVWSPDGTRIAVGGSSYGLYIIDTGTGAYINPECTAEWYTVCHPFWFPDGLRVAYSNCGDYCECADCWAVYDTRSQSCSLLFQLPNVGAAAWSPDGERIAFSTKAGIYVMKTDGSESPRKIHGGQARTISWSSDGGKISFDWYGTIFVLDPNGGEAFPIAGDRYMFPTWLPK